MRKITDLYETRWRTIRNRDKYGTLISESEEEYEIQRKVRIVESGPRFGHFFVDYIVFRLLVYGLFYIFGTKFIDNNVSELSLMSQRIIAILYSGLFFGLMYSLYYFLFEYFLQKTPGKYLTQTIVIYEYGNKPTFQQILLRSLIRIIPFEWFSCFDERGWHDSWTDTYVVPVKELVELKKLMEIDAKGTEL